MITKREHRASSLKKEIRNRFKQQYGDADPRAMMDQIVKEQENLVTTFKRHNKQNYVRKTGQKMILDFDHETNGELHSPETVFQQVYNEPGTQS